MYICCLYLFICLFVYICLDITNIEETGVGWSCPPDIDLGCVFRLRIQLTAEVDVDRIVISGLTDGVIVSPQIEILELRTDPNTLNVDNNLYSITIPIDDEITNVSMRLSIGSGKNLVLTEITVYSTEDINISVLNPAYSFSSVVPIVTPTSPNIATTQLPNIPITTTTVLTENQNTPNTVATTSTSLNNMNTTNTTFTPQNTTNTTFTPQKTTIQTNTTFTPQKTTNTTFTPQNTTNTTFTPQKTTNTTFTPQNTTIQTNTDSPRPEATEDCKIQSISLSIIGVLSIFIVTMLFNSIIIIALLAKNNRKIRRKLNTLEQAKKDTPTIASYIKSYKKRHTQPELGLTVVENRIAADDMYELPEPRQEPISVNIIHNMDSGFASPSAAVSQLQNNNFNNLSVNTDYVQMENLSLSAQKETKHDSDPQDEFEVPIQENTTYSSIQRTGLPRISIENCDNSIYGNSLDVPMEENIGYISNLEIPMQENTAYSSIQRTGVPRISIENCDNSIYGSNLDIPMEENIGYISTKNVLVVNRPTEPNGIFNGKVENSDIKHIYASITNECCVEFPIRNTGEFPSYNVLVHK